MMDADKLYRRTLFDTVADEYDAARPSYPREMVDDIVAGSRIPEGGRILEIGPGTGQATRLFAERRYRILGLELGANLAAKARSNLRDFPNAIIQNVAFEEWEVEEGAFDLVISGSAFHWIPAELGYARCRAALKPAGSLALFWNTDPRPEGTVYAAIRAAHERLAPDLSKPGPDETPEAAREKRERGIADSGCFSPPMVLTYPWSRRYDADEYVRLYNTYSTHIALPPEQNQALCSAIREAIAENGGYIDRQYLTTLYLARRA